jgi:hypothetical protein
MRVAPAGRTQWRFGDGLSLATLNAVGLGLVLLGWYIASGRLLLHDQVTGANVAIAGIVVAGVGDAMWLLVGRRTLGLRRRAMTTRIAASGRWVRPADTTTTLVAAKGITRYHRDDCPFAVGRRVFARRRETHEAQGRRPCGVCKP